MPTVKERHQKQQAKLSRNLQLRGWKYALQALNKVRGLEVGKTRKDGSTPKFHHQVAVGRLVWTLVPHLDQPENTLTAAFLHDVLEDYGDRVSIQALARQFGNETTRQVLLLTKKYRGEVKTYEDYFSSIALCPVASVVKLADRAHNIQTMDGVFSADKQRAYIEEVRSWFYPLIRQARRNHPNQYDAYENLKILLRCQVALLRQVLSE